MFDTQWRCIVIGGVSSTAGTTWHWRVQGFRINFQNETIFKRDHQTMKFPLYQFWEEMHFEPDLPGGGEGRIVIFHIKLKEGGIYISF